MSDLRVLIVESDAFLRQSLVTHCEGLAAVDVAGAVPDPAGARRVAAQARADVVLLEIPEPPDLALAFAEWLRVEQPETVVLAASPANRPEILRRAMRAGAQDLLARPIDPGQLGPALEFARQRKAKRVRPPEERGQLVAALGVGGGIGTTTIATNLAVAMAAAANGDPGGVLLADFDLEMGNVPCFLDLKPTRTYLDLKGELDLPNAEGLRQLLPRHRTGVYMLAGPQQIEDLDDVSPAEVSRALDLCRSAFSRVVVDAGHGFDERTIEVLDRADLILLVTQLNVAALRSARRVGDALGRLGYPEAQVKVVANRVPRGGSISLGEAGRSIGHPVAFTVPNDYPAAIAAIDTGVPVVAAKRSGRLAASLKTIARDVAPPASRNGDRPRAGGLRRLLAPIGGR